MSNGKVFLAGPRGKEAEKYKWACKECHTNGNHGNRLNCHGCGAWLSPQQQNAARNREAAWLKAKGKPSPGAGNRPNGGGPMGNGQQRQGQGGGAGAADKAKDRQIQSLTDKLASLEAKVAARELVEDPPPASTLAGGDPVQEVKLVQDLVAHWESVGRHEAAKALKPDLERAKLLVAGAKMPTTKKQVLAMQTTCDAKINKLEKKKVGLEEAIKKAGEELSTAEEELQDLYKEKKSLVVKMQSLAVQEGDSSFITIFEDITAKNAGKLSKCPEAAKQMEALGQAVQKIQSLLEKVEETDDKEEVPVPMATEPAATAATAATAGQGQPAATAATAATAVKPPDFTWTEEAMEQLSKLWAPPEGKTDKEDEPEAKRARIGTFLKQWGSARIGPYGQPG